MPQIVQEGQINLAALNVPDLIVQIIPPQLLINGVPSNVVGFVGTASWGPTNVPQVVGGYQSGTLQFGNPNPRQYDLMTAVYAASLQGAQAFRLVRVTDGTDTAASIVIQTNCLTLTALYTGSVGNGIVSTIGNGSQLNTIRITNTLGSQVPELFDNISEAVVDFSVTPGTWTQCPELIQIGAPTLSGGVQAVAAPQLVATGTPAISAGGSAYQVNDEVTLANGLTVKVLTVSAGTIASVEVVDAGSVPAGETVPSNPMAQTSTTGSGTGASFNVTWGLGTPILETGGSGYYGDAPSVTLVGGNFTSEGTITANIAYWPNIAAAINNGISGLRGPSALVTATAGVGTQSPTLAGYTLSGGTDGANPASIGTTGTPALVGQDSIPRTGMYAMSSANISIAALVDCDDATTWSTQVAFGSQQGIYMIGVGEPGEDLTTATSTSGPKAQYGIDNFTFKLMLGDWCYINDPITGAQRMISPQGFVCGFMGNQTPNETPLNQPMNGIVGTEKSQTGIQYTSADLQALSTAGIDVICNPNPGGSYFGLRLGINTSSNLAVNGDNYTRLTYFIAQTLAAGCGAYVGQLQTPTERLQAMTTLASFFANLEAEGLIGTADGTPCYQIVLNDSNNSFSQVSLGYQYAQVQVTYLSVIRYFVIDLQGGQTVQINTTSATGTVSPSLNQNTGVITG